MIGTRYVPLVFKKVVRHRARTALTVGGIAAAMFLFCAVQAMHEGVRQATELTAKDNTLIVYRENRYCPATSRLPEYYGPRIAKVPGVAVVIPMKIVVNNCRTSLDVVTFRGAPADEFVRRLGPKLQVLEGSMADWEKRSDAAMVGETLARRRGLKIGDRFDAAGVTVYVAGIMRSDEPQDHNVAYVQLNFLQQTVDRNKLGIVTQFNVTVTDPSKLADVARAIDLEFSKDSDPTRTSPDKAFVARAASDIVEIAGFARWLGWGCLAAVMALVGNAIVLSVQDRIKEHAILQTLGFEGGLILRLIVAEGVTLGILGGLAGTLASAMVIYFGAFAISTEGLSISISSSPMIALGGLGLSALLGAVASLVPAWQASRREIAACFRAV